MKKRKMNPKLKNKIWNGSILAAFLAAVGVFAFLVQTEKRVLAEYEKEQVCVVTAEIPKGEKITGENAGQYITIAEIDKSIVPQSALKDIEEATGSVAVYGIEEGTVLTAGMLREEAAIIGQMEEPVIAGFRAEDMYQVVGGVLRAGDKIHIYCVDQEQGEEADTGKILWENVWVQQVFDQAGAVISGKDNTTPAQRINIYLDNGGVADFYAALAQGSLRVVKICD